MSDYEIGKEIQGLSSRIDRIELRLGVKTACRCTENANISMIRHEATGGISDKEPVLWKLEKGERLPPFISSFMHLPLGVHQFAAPPRSKTWTGSPEPFILTVNWSDGGSDEFFRLVNQTFSVFEWTDPNTNVVATVATYSATLIASGQAKTGVGSTASMQLVVRGAGGTPLLIYNYPFSVTCSQNGLFIVSQRMLPGQFDLVGGVTWTIAYTGIYSC